MKHEDMYTGRLLWYTKPEDPDLKFPCMFISGDGKKALVKTDKAVKRIAYRYLLPREVEWCYGKDN